MDLILDQYGFQTWGSGGSNSQMEYAIEVIKDSSDALLEQLYEYLISGFESGESLDIPFNPQRLKLFASHLASERIVVGQVKFQLDRMGIDLFVAHDSIEISREWQKVIESGLASCEGMVAFLHEGFRDSNWCDQEIGWVMGRKLPVLLLKYSVDPHGFPAKYQALKVENATPSFIANSIWNWAWNIKSFRPQLSNGLIDAFVNSRSFDSTRSLIAKIEVVEFITDEQLVLMENSAVSNSQIYDAIYNRESVATWVNHFVATRRRQNQGINSSDVF